MPHKFGNIFAEKRYEDYGVKVGDRFMVEIDMKQGKGSIYFVIDTRRRDLVFNASLPESCAICVSFGQEVTFYGPGHGFANFNQYKVSCIDQRYL